MTISQRIDKLNKTYPRRTEWWSRVFATPMAHFSLALVGDLKIVTPTRLTVLSLLLVFVSSALIIRGVDYDLIFAAILIQVSYIFDCMDGQLARYRGTSNLLGAFLDKMFDFIKFPILIFALMWGSSTHLQSSMVFIYGFLVIFFAGFIFYLKSMSKADFGIGEWDVLSGNSFRERNFRFFLFEESQWYLFLSIILIFKKTEQGLLFFAVILGVLSVFQAIRVARTLTTKK